MYEISLWIDCEINRWQAWQSGKSVRERFEKTLASFGEWRYQPRQNDGETPRADPAWGKLDPLRRLAGDALMRFESDLIARGIARDESLTRGLGDEEARLLVDWLVGWGEILGETTRTPVEAQRLADRLCRRGRAIGRFVQLWAEPHSRASAAQLAACERFTWPLPAEATTAPADLMEHILNWERQHQPL